MADSGTLGCRKPYQNTARLRLFLLWWREQKRGILNRSVWGGRETRTYQLNRWQAWQAWCAAQQHFSWWIPGAKEREQASRVVEFIRDYDRKLF